MSSSEGKLSFDQKKEKIGILEREGSLVIKENKSLVDHKLKNERSIHLLNVKDSKIVFGQITY